MTGVPPPLLASEMRPSDPRPTSTRFGTVLPGPKFTLDVLGVGAPVGYTVTNPAALGPVTVTLTAMAVAVFGMPASPPICDVAHLARLERDLAREAGVEEPGGGDRVEPAGEPARHVDQHVGRPNGVEHRHEPAGADADEHHVRHDLAGDEVEVRAAGQRRSPAGNTVRKPAAVGPTTVTFSATATAVAGMPARPVIWTLRTSPGPSGVEAGRRVS